MSGSSMAGRVRAHYTKIERRRGNHNGFQKTFLDDDDDRRGSFIRLARMGKCTRPRINGAINAGSMGTLWPRKRSSDSKNISSRFKSKRRCPLPRERG